MNLQSSVDSPKPEGPYYRQRIPVEGWIYGDYRHDRLKRVSAHGPSGEIGSTTHFYPRADVSQAHRLPAGTRTGFRFLACIADPYQAKGRMGLEIRAEFSDGSMVPIAGIHVRIMENDFTGAPYGKLCNPDQSALLHREDIYAVGGRSQVANSACVELLAAYLPEGASLIDINCGVGAYCEPMRKADHAWVGCESSIECLHGLALHSRPHRAIKIPRWPWSTYQLPAADREFDAALVIDGLERVRNTEPLLKEVARVTRRHAFFSVPNLETLPFLADRMVAPWHLLKGDHVNFFTRFNLRPLLLRYFRHVEILDYGDQPLASPEGIVLPYQLFAICEI
jgi:hypothetical protein